MAYYIPKFGACFGASCADLWDQGPSGGAGPGPGSGLPYFPGLPSLPSMPGVNVSVGVEGGGPGVAMMPYVESPGLPWWLWLAIGILVARAMD